MEARSSGLEGWYRQARKPRHLVNDDMARRTDECWLQYSWAQVILLDVIFVLYGRLLHLFAFSTPLAFENELRNVS